MLFDNDLSMARSGPMMAKLDVTSSSIRDESPGSAIRVPGRRYSSGPGPFRPIARTVPAPKSATDSTSSVQSVTRTRPSGSSRTPRTRLNSCGSVAAAARRTGAGSACASASSSRVSDERAISVHPRGVSDRCAAALDRRGSRTRAEPNPRRRRISTKVTHYPVESTIPELAQALRSGAAAVLQAPPGAGKTTIVPPALLDEPWLAGRRIVMLEPRRLAARAAARRMAQLLGEQVGETVGYRVRLDTRVGPRTRIEVVTEGILARMLHEDPALDRVGCVIFDEFHERSLHADLGLALALQSRELLRVDLRLLVMSATLDGAAVAALLGEGTPVVTSEG